MRRIYQAFMHPSQQTFHGAGKMPTPQEKSLYCGMGVPPVLKMVQDLSYPKS
jgi:hypothetical protein